MVDNVFPGAKVMRRAMESLGVDKSADLMLEQFGLHDILTALRNNCTAICTKDPESAVHFQAAVRGLNMAIEEMWK